MNITRPLINMPLQASTIKLLVAAIDFGTTYSGWAFSFKHEYNADPTKVSCKQWFGGQLVSMKAPTTVLIKPDRKTLHSFGYEAETKYAELASDDGLEYKQWYYFSRFKMMLYGKTTFDRDMTLKDETQKTLSAQTVFSLVIRYLKEDLLNTCRERLTKGHIMEDEITWVLTVPAIWNDSAKQFMREAAEKAGISSENLMIALEPETASLFCRLLPVDKMVEGRGMSSFQPGSKYMVIDAGGGTVDITVHQVMPGGKLKEIHKASGGAWGGIQVDEAFRQFIISLVGNAVFSRFQAESKEDYLDMLREFEIKKKDIYPDSDKKVTIRFPSSMKEIYEEETDDNFCNAIKQTGFGDKISLSGDKLRVESSVMKSLFSSAIESILSHVKELIKDRKVSRISSIVMVGGFSESKMLQGAIKACVPSVKVIIPQEAGLVVLKGAVVFGHSPFSITLRICKYTYGVDVAVPFDYKIHDPTKRIEEEDGPYCDDIFSKHVETGQPIALNETTEETPYYPMNGNQTSIEFNIYASDKKSPMYVTDEGCVKLGTMNVVILDMSVPSNKRSVLVSMAFGGTELEVKAREKRTGRVTKATVNFLG